MEETATILDLHSPAPPHGSARAVTPTKIASFIETTKPGITKLVTITSLVGFVMAAALRARSAWELAVLGLACGVGTALSAAGANAINQYMERERDAVMPRTVRRPLPQRRLTPASVLALGVFLGVAGCGILWLMNGPAPALISLACIVSYIAMYTPMKTRTSLSTFMGAIPGALPPLIGWTAGGVEGWQSLRDPGGLSLFILMFVWQIPHFLAIAWMYRDDYAKGGYVVLPVIDPAGGWTSATIGLWSAALIPATLLPAIVMPDRLGVPYLSLAAVSGVAFFLLGVRVIRTRGRREARHLFFGSIIHLPLILVAMTCETLVRSLLA